MKKIETFGEFCELVSKDSENVVYTEVGDNVHTTMKSVLACHNRLDNWFKMKEWWNDETDYYYITPEPKKTITVAHFEVWGLKTLYRKVVVFKIINDKPHYFNSEKDNPVEHANGPRRFVKEIPGTRREEDTND